jgi:hypothetical protein
MPRVPWHLFQDRQARAHLIVAVVEQADVADDQLNAVQALLKRLVSWQKPAGDYAAMLVRAAGRPEVYWAFEDEGDANRFAATLHAEATASYPGWASQRALQLDGAKLAAMEASLPAPKQNPRPVPANGLRLLGRTRRGPRAPNSPADWDC